MFQSFNICSLLKHTYKNENKKQQMCTAKNKNHMIFIIYVLLIKIKTIYLKNEKRVKMI